MIPLPAWIDAELWDEYVKQRKKDKKEMSPRSERERLARLYALKAAGHDPNQSLSEALNGHWLDFYEPRDKAIEPAAVAATDRIKRELDQLDERKTKPPADLRARVMSNLRRVA